MGVTNSSSVILTCVWECSPRKIPPKTRQKSKQQHRIFSSPSRCRKRQINLTSLRKNYQQETTNRRVYWISCSHDRWFYDRLEFCSVVCVSCHHEEMRLPHLKNIISFSRSQQHWLNHHENNFLQKHQTVVPQPAQKFLIDILLCRRVSSHF